MELFIESQSSQGNLGIYRQSGLQQIEDLDRIQEQRSLSAAEIAERASLIKKMENIAKHEEIAWRQR